MIEQNETALELNLIRPTLFVLLPLPPPPPYPFSRLYPRIVYTYFCIITETTQSGSQLSRSHYHSSRATDQHPSLTTTCN